MIKEESRIERNLSETLFLDIWLSLKVWPISRNKIQDRNGENPYSVSNTDHQLSTFPFTIQNEPKLQSYIKIALAYCIAITQQNWLSFKICYKNEAESAFQKTLNVNSRSIYVQSKRQIENEIGNFFKVKKNVPPCKI